MSITIQSDIVHLVSSVPGVFVMPVAGDDLLCSVKMSIERRELIRSGSMQFNHLRYHTFGQMVWIKIREQSEAPFYDPSGAIHFTVKTAEEAAEYIKNIQSHVPHDIEEPQDTVLIKEVS